MTETAPPTTPLRAGPSGRTKALLIASLALNLLFVGAMGGAFLRGGASRGAQMRDLNFGPLTEALTKEHRAELRRQYIAAAPELRDERAGQRGDVEALLQVLRAATFERAAVATIFAHQMERTRTRLTLGQGMVLDLLTRMTPEARAAFADRLESVLSRDRKGDKP